MKIIIQSHQNFLFLQLAIFTIVVHRPSSPITQTTVQLRYRQDFPCAENWKNKKTISFRCKGINIVWGLSLGITTIAAQLSGLFKFSSNFNPLFCRWLSCLLRSAPPWVEKRNWKNIINAPHRKMKKSFNYKVAADGENACAHGARLSDVSHSQSHCEETALWDFLVWLLQQLFRRCNASFEDYFHQRYRIFSFDDWKPFMLDEIKTDSFWNIHQPSQCLEAAKAFTARLVDYFPRVTATRLLHILPVFFAMKSWAEKQSDHIFRSLSVHGDIEVLNKLVCTSCQPATRKQILLCEVTPLIDEMKFKLFNFRLSCGGGFRHHHGTNFVVQQPRDSLFNFHQMNLESSLWKCSLCLEQQNPSRLLGRIALKKICIRGNLSSRRLLQLCIWFQSLKLWSATRRFIRGKIPNN